MAIGALYGDVHSFMHDLESFFWVLFWICIHYNGPNERSRVVSGYESWIYLHTNSLAAAKVGNICDDRLFSDAMANVTPYFQPFISWLEELRTIVFPNRRAWRIEDETLYERMREVLRKAMTDPKVLAE